MRIDAPSTTAYGELVEFWRKRFRRQKHLMTGVRALLRKYGSAGDRGERASALLLTLMGNFGVPRACFYRRSPDGGHMAPIVSYGGISTHELPSLPVTCPFATVLASDRVPQLINSLPRTATDGDDLAELRRDYLIAAPMLDHGELVGIVLLGPRASSAMYTNDDIELMDALCSVSATIFSSSDAGRPIGISADETGALLARCRLMAGGVARHLDDSLTAIEVALQSGEDGREVVLQRTDSMRHLVSSLRALERDPASLDSGVHARFRVMDVVHEAIFSAGVDAHTTIRTGDYERAGLSAQIRMQRGDVVEAVRDTLGLARATGGSEVDIMLDVADGLPASIGEEAAAAAATDSWLRVRIGVPFAPGGDDEGGRMRILADNVSAYHTLHEPTTAQAVVVASGGAVVARRDAEEAAWLLYFPLDPS